MGRDAAASASIVAIAIRFQLPLVFVVMAVEAQQFPVAAIGRIIVVIVVPVMNRQFAQIGVFEFAAAATADPGIDLERLLSITLFAHCSSPAGLSHYAVQFVRVFRFHASISFAGS